MILNIVIDKYTPQIAGEINKATGLSSGLEELRIVTTPKLTAGLKVKKFELYTPQKEPGLIANNFQVKMSLLPILTKNIRIDVVKLDNADITLKLDSKGELDIIQYFPQSEENSNQDMPKTPSYLPFGLKLSNHLPDFHIGSYKVTFTDGKENYFISGGKTDITDFIINKSIKVKGGGKFVLRDREQFEYDIKLFNKIMPDIDLNELVFNPQKNDTENKDTQPVDILSILRGLYDYNVSMNAAIDLKTTKESLDGIVKADNISVINLTPSNANLIFKGNSIDIVSNLYTAKNEVSKINGKITTGKNPFIDMSFKSDAEISNVLEIVKKIALIFNIKDLQTLTANGKINADFNIKSDTKKVNSSGFLKIPAAKLYYGLYKIGIDNINADINLENNNINIKNVGFSVLGQPLKLYGSVSQDAVSDLHLTANKLNLKGLIIALGQAAIMKENPIYSGNVSMDIIIKGKLDKINPLIKVDIDNIDLKNIPLDIRIKAPSTHVNITSDGKVFSGNAQSSNISLVNPALGVTIPNLKANIYENAIEITQTPVTIEKIKTSVSGKITDYLTEKIGLNFVSTGDIKSTLTGDINTTKQTLNLVYSTTDLSTIIIPMFDKSKMSFKGKINITGNMLNPVISGNAHVPSISIPEIPVEMKNMDVKLNGTILHGSASLSEFSSGGIKAENCSSDFELKGVDFYLNNLKGFAFGGKINGNIIYNMSNAKTTVDFHGSGLDAERAAEGATGIKKALTGTLSFNTKLNLTVLDYNEMMKSMKGNLDFNIKNGAFGTIGRFESLLNASNLLNNYILKNTVSAISNATGLASTGTFDNIEGTMSLSDGWANLNYIKSAGKSLCYYVTGKYNLINGTTNINILGRLDAAMVAKLGPIGELSADKLLGYIPKFGNATANILNLITTNPAGEKVDLIPPLTNGSTNYKDFKVVFNGGIESKNSIKSFKWLSKPDLSEMESKSVTETVKDIKSAVTTDVKQNIDNVNEMINTNKQLIKDTSQAIKDTKEQYKNLLKSLRGKDSSDNSTSVTEEAPHSDSTTTTSTSSSQQAIPAVQKEDTQPSQTEKPVETISEESKQQANTSTEAENAE